MFDADITKLDLDCPKTWALISSGNTKGCFQLESRLGRSMAKKLKPTNIEQLSGLLSILRPGCISGDTRITVACVTDKGVVKQKTVTMAELYLKKHKYTHIISYDENTGTLKQNKLNNIFFTGIKECYKVFVQNHRKKISNGHNLICTDDHELLTDSGWKELKDIKVGERILVTKKNNSLKSNRANIKSRHSSLIEIENIDGIRSYQARCYENYKYSCVFCSWNNGSLDVNHIEGNRHTNNSVENLCFLCPNHHREYTEGKINKEELLEARKGHELPKTTDCKWVTFTGKESVGKTNVFDISMEAPTHNFIAGNVIVHNCLEAMRDNKSVSNHYIDKKNGSESIDYFHDALEPILKNTYGEMIYQEQAMEIARVIAGFNLQEADMLRKAIGKKKPEEMAKIKKTFIDGCKTQNIISEIQADQIFGWIEKSQRYSFNKSHAISYAMNSYLSAYAKAHYPRIFFASYLRFAKDKIDPQTEIKELVQNAIEMDIVICNPDIRKINKHVELDKDCIYFGLTDIKGFGESAYNKLSKIVKEKQLDLATMCWLDYLFVLSNINSTSAKALIQSGALDFLRVSRNKMLFEYNIFVELTKKEQELLLSILDKNKSLSKNLYYLTQQNINKKRKNIICEMITSLDFPPHSLEDSIEWIADIENMLLGYSISCTKIDMYDISMVSCSCKEFKTNKTHNKTIMIAGEIEAVRTVKTKKGKDAGSEMAFVSINDGTASVDSVVFFPESYRQFRNFLFEGNILIIKGQRSKNNDGLIAEKAFIPRS